jgi:phytoene synthase
MQALSTYVPEGSDIYYVLRQVPAAKKTPYLALHAFAFELYKISAHYQELSIAQQKLAWWFEEIKRMYQNQATHPITQSLYDFIAVYDLKEIELLAMIEATVVATTTQIFATTNELRQHYQHTCGIVTGLKAKVLLPEAQNIIVMMHQLGVAAGILKHLLDFPKFLQRQHLYLPLSLFQAQGIDPQPMLQGKDLERVKPLFQAEFITAKSIYIETKNKLSIKQQQLLKPLLLETLLLIKQVNKTANKGWQIFNYRLELSPLYKFFLTEFFR